MIASKVKNDIWKLDITLDDKMKNGHFFNTR